MKRTLGSLVACNALLAAVYFAAGRLGLRLALEHSSASPVWPPTGLALAAVLAFGPRLAPAIFLGAFLANITIGNHPVSATYVMSCLGIATGNTLEAIAGWGLLNRWAHGVKAFDHPRDAFFFTLLAGGPVTMVSSTIGVTSLCLGEYASWDSFNSVWLTWWLGDAVSALTITPPLVLWWLQPRLDWSRDKTAKAMTLLFLILVLAQAVFGWLGPASTRHHPFAFAFLPILVWSAYNLGPRETATATLLVAGLALLGTLRGHGPFAPSSAAEAHQSLLFLTFFVGITAVTALVLGAVVADRHRSEQALRAAHDELEARVRERTAILAQTNENLRQEIAERLQADRALRQEQRRADAIIETAFDAFIGMDADGRITDWNARAEAMFGWTRPEALGRVMAEIIVPPDLRSGFFQGMQHYLETGETRVLNKRLELAAQHRQGHLFPVELAVWQSQQQGPIRFYAFVHDISARKEAESKLRQSERLAVIGEMMAALAHESRNALQRSQACLELLALKINGNAGAVKLLDDIQHAQDYLHELYERVRRFAAPVVLELKETDLGRLLEQTWDELAVVRRGRQAQLRQSVAAGSLACRVDPLALSQVFRNLLENSLAACADPVEIHASWQEVTWNDGPALHVALRDNGPGLSPQVRQKLFEPFFTTKSRGTGLGMAIARRLIEAHGGCIGAGPDQGCPDNGSSQRSGGAEFLLTLPRNAS